MRALTLGLAATAALALSGCATHRLGDRARPDEFAVTRAAPLVVPPDFNLTPPKPGQPNPNASDVRQQAIQALFGGPSPRSEAEQQLLKVAGNDAAAPGARSVAGDPNTVVVDKGPLTQTILAVPEGDGAEARTSVPK